MTGPTARFTESTLSRVKHQFCRQKVVQFNSNESQDWAERPEVAIINKIHYAKAATVLLPRAATLLDKHK